ncbi:hypothetical protein NK718_13870 [Alsobacter sp. SYSU M60028]|uniref:Uncharacterized protein n=1 Tax=Alsobacter ponti TaxID=2962936 RepID=A0ABT1LDM9_9HYPH|nr:hypothetical protein [Alsobacter ponti]MCP8939610.1 hypothetical protein [Alsobacter ponti]
MRRAWVAAIFLAGLAGAATAQTTTPPAATLSTDELRALVEATRATAQAARENVDYSRVVPDILTQILAKLDKIEDKLGRIEDAQKAASRRAR